MTIRHFRVRCRQERKKKKTERDAEKSADPRDSERQYDPRHPARILRISHYLRLQETHLKAL
jgi:uncharacterized membrane protein YqiK